MITLLLEVIYIILALLQLLVAPRVGPNPYFGFKIGYTFSSKEVWEKTNRFAGMLMTVHSLAILPLALMGDEYFIPFLIAYIVPIMGIVVVGIIYSARLLEEIKVSPPSKEPIKPINVGLIWKHSASAIFLLLLIMIGFTYNALPQTLAVHFDSSGNPNGWADKDSFVIQYLILSFLYLGIVYLVTYLGMKHPIIIHSGIMRIGRDTLLKAVILTMDLVLLLLIEIYLIIFAQNTGKWDTGMFQYALLSTVAIIILPIAYIVYRWKREGS